jgi:hypothetical protein
MEGVIRGSDIDRTGTQLLDLGDIVSFELAPRARRPSQRREGPAGHHEPRLRFGRLESLRRTIASAPRAWPLAAASVKAAQVFLPRR